MIILKVKPYSLFLFIILLTAGCNSNSSSHSSSHSEEQGSNDLQLSFAAPIVQYETEEKVILEWNSPPEDNASYKLNSINNEDSITAYKLYRSLSMDSIVSEENLIYESDDNAKNRVTDIINTGNNNYYKVTAISENGEILESNIVATSDEKENILWEKVHGLRGITKYGSTYSAYDDKVFIIGGSSHGIVDVVEEYNTSTNLFTARAPMPTGRYMPCSCVFKNLIYVIGGIIDFSSAPSSDFEVYNPSEDSWEVLYLPFSVSEHACVTVGDYIYLFGGYFILLDGEEFWEGYSRGNEVFRYDPTENQWSLITKIPNREFTSYHPTVLHDSRIYVVGGGHISYDSPIYKKIDVYNILAENWEESIESPFSFQSLVDAAVWQDYLLILARVEVGSEEFLEEFWIYDIYKDTWMKIPQLHEMTFFGAFIVVENSIYMIEGLSYEGMSEPDASVQRFDLTRIPLLE